MKKFNRGGRSHDRHGGGGFGRRDRERPSMHHAVCDACHKDCEVPFKPTNDKPIYCSDCFDKQGGRQNNRPNRFGGQRDRQSSFGHGDSEKSKEILEAIKSLSHKMDELIKVVGKTPTVVPEVVAEKPATVTKKKTVAKKATTKKVATKKKTVAKKATAKKKTTKKK